MAAKLVMDVQALIEMSVTRASEDWTLGQVDPSRPARMDAACCTPVASPERGGA